MTSTSPLWERLARSWPSDFDPHIGSWRREGTIAGALSVRDPTRGSNGLRFYLSMLMILLSASDSEDKELYLQVPNRNIGNPYSVRFFGTDIDMDYYKSIQEFKAIRGHVPLDGSTIMEIGGGYGRLAHTILSLQPSVREYIMVDIPITLEVARKYLAAVLPPELFRVVKFVDALTEFSSFKQKVDIVINVDSMNEMDASVVLDYLEWIDANADYFYVNNPVGKYVFPPDAALSEAGNVALSVGPITQIFDLWDDDSISERLGDFLRVYTPGKIWDVVYSGRALPWVYYGTAIYRKSTARTY